MSLPTVEELAKYLETEELVTLITNPNTESEKRYKVQRVILVNASVWFKKALTGEWTETQRLTLQLPDVEPRVIEQFLYYLMSGQACLPNHSLDAELLAVRLWVFADKYMLPTLQNQAMRWLYNAHNPGYSRTVYPSIHTIAEALETSVAGSKLYKIMMWLLVNGMHSGGANDENAASSSRLGHLLKADVMSLERISGLMTEVLTQSILIAFGSKEIPRGLYLDKLLVAEG